MTRHISNLAVVVALAIAPGIPVAAQDGPAEPRVFTQIDVQGNSRFSDGDVLATAGLQPGGFYGEDDLRAAIEDLEFTGEFDSVRIRSAGDRLTITVDETPEFEGRLIFGAGFDSDSGAFGGAAVSIENALGIGAEIQGEVTIAEEVQTARLTIFDPDALGETIGAGIRLSYSNFDFDNTLFAYERFAIAPYLSFDLGSAGRLETRLEFSQTDLSEVDPTASAILQGEVGEQDAISFGVTYIYGGVDRRVDALTWGALFDVEYAFAGDADYIRTQAQADVFQPLPAGFALRSTLELGHITGLNGFTPRATDRFVLGGSALRGFERGTVSVRDINGATVTNLGGNSYGVLRTDLLLPVFAEQTALDVFVFGDLGSVWDLETSTAPSGTLLDDATLRSSVGIGASYDFDFGRLEAYIAAPGSDEIGDQEQIFGLTFRARF